MSHLASVSSVALLAGLMVVVAPAKAQSLYENEAATARAIGASVDATLSPGWSADPGRPTVDTGVWLSHRKAAIGLALSSPIDVVLPNPTLPPLHGGSATSMLMGVRYDVGTRSRLYVDTLAAARDVRMGFEFKPAPSQALAIARGTLFRVQWSSTSQVSLRLRGGGLTVALRSQF